MYFEPIFLFDNQLVAAIEDLIRKSNKNLLLISPFIDLDPRIKDALSEKKQNPDFQLLVLFGKNENNIYRSIKKDSFSFLKEFPNIEIRYNERLHAKFYQNDYDFIITSMNLYDYSLANNIEVGILCNYASKGILGKLGDGAGNLIEQGIGKVKQGVLGEDKETNPIEKFQLIFETSELKYKTEPIIKETKILGVTTKKVIEGFNVIENKLDFIPTTTVTPETVMQTESLTTTITTTQTITTEIKYMSASQISKGLGLQAKDISAAMEQKGLVKDEEITDLGKQKGLIWKSYMGRDYIAYPDNLEELKNLK
ncbi:MAG: phospholipase D-like domain-containing protein [Lacibacter sp.]